MMPTLRHRLFICIAITVGAICWWAVGPWLSAADGSTGISLMSARVPPAVAILLALVAAVPAVGAGLAVSSAGHPLSGLFAVSCALGILAIWGGPIDGWMFRNNLPNEYGWLMFETLIWFAGVLIMLTVVQQLRSPMRVRIPALAFDDHLDVDTHIRWPQAQAMGAGLTCAIVSAALAWACIADSDSGQVIGSLLLAFTVGGMVGQLLFPQSNPIGILFSPGLVAMVAYAYVLIRFSSTDQVMAAWFGRSSGLALSQRLPGIALALPIHYASAALAGTTMGIGIAHTIESTKNRVVSS